MNIAHTFLLLVLFISIAGRGMASGNRIETDLIGLDHMIQFYRLTTGTLPPADIGLGALVEPPPNLPADAKWKKMLVKIPVDPWERPYSYVLDSDLPGGYGIFSRGLDGVSRTVGNDPDDFNSWSPTRRGIEVNPIKSMPWLLPSIASLVILFFYLGVRVQRHWNQNAQQAMPPNGP
jgi:general secretion pathway protein G